MCIGVCVYVCAPHACSAPPGGGLEDGVRTQELELQMTMSHCVGTGSLP